jgi:DNA-binding MarR family transcriptional regulator
MNKVPHILKLLRDYDDNKKIYQRALFEGNWKVTVTQVGVLRTLARHEYLTTTQLADAIGIHITTADGYSKRLKQKGLIEVRSNPEDRRSKLLSINKKGLKILDEVPLGFKSLLVSNLYTRATEEEVATIEKGLELLVKYLNENCEWSSKE